MKVERAGFFTTQRRTLALGWASLLLVVAWCAQAAPPPIAGQILPDRIRVIYESPAECPNRTEFMTRVTERVTLPWVADDTELARQVRVTIGATPVGYSAHLEYADDAGRQVVRAVEGETCEQAVTGIALVTALAIDSQLVSIGPSTNPNATLAAVTSSALQPAATPPVVAPHYGPENSPPRAAANGPFRDASSPRLPPPPDATYGLSPLSQEAGLALGVAAGLAPGPALGASAFWGLSRGAAPVFRLTLSWYDYQSSSANPALPTAHFSLFTASAQLCKGIVATETVELALVPCAGIDAGLYKVKGQPPTASLSPPSATTVNHFTLFWPALLFSLPIRVQSKGVFGELVPDFRLMLASTRFEFRSPDSTVYETPRMAWGLRVASGLKF